MVNKIETTNSEKKPIIDNDEALRLIDLIQLGDSNAENDLAELCSVLSRLWQSSMLTRVCRTKNLLQPVDTECYVPVISSTSRAASSLPRMPYGGCAKLFCKRFVKKKTISKTK